MNSILQAARSRVERQDFEGAIIKMYSIYKHFYDEKIQISFKNTNKNLKFDVRDNC